MIAIVSTSREREALEELDFLESNSTLICFDEYAQTRSVLEPERLVGQLFADVRAYSRVIFYKPFLASNDDRDRSKIALINRLLRVRLFQAKSMNAPFDLNAAQIHKLNLLDQWALLHDKGLETPEFMFTSNDIQSDLYHLSNPRNAYKWGPDDLTDSADLKHFFKFAVKRPSHRMLAVGFYKNSYNLKTNYTSTKGFPRVADYLIKIQELFRTDFGELIMFCGDSENFIFGGLCEDFVITTPAIIFNHLKKFEVN